MKKSPSFSQNKNKSTSKSKPSKPYEKGRFQGKRRFKDTDKDNEKGRDRDRNKGRDKKFEKPKKEYTSLLVPEGWSPKGEAELKQKGNRLLLWSGIPEEKGLYRMVHRGKHQSLLEFVESKNPHPHRIAASCAHYTPCGGCPLMHLQDEGQKEAKLNILRQALLAQELEEHCPEEIYTDTQWKFRHQVKLVVTEERGSVKVGVRNRRNRLAAIPNCEVVTKQLKLIAKRLAHKIIAHSKKQGPERLLAYSNEHATGLRYIVARQSFHTKNIHLCFVATHSKGLYTDFANWLVDGNLPVTGVSLHINEDEGNAIFERTESGYIRSEVLRGQRCIEEVINGIHYQVGVGDFFQVNPVVAGVIQQDLVALAQPFKDHPMVDLYCGVGFFSLALSKAFGHVIGIEGIGGAIQRAKDNALLNNLKADFYAGQVEELIERNLCNLNRPFVVVDPARRGLEEGVVELLDKMVPCAIAYVSCSPHSFAEDIKKFKALGWDVADIKSYDMIPHSAHIELLALLIPDPKRVKEYRKPKRRIVR